MNHITALDHVSHLGLDQIIARLDRGERLVLVSNDGRYAVICKSRSGNIILGRRYNIEGGEYFETSIPAILNSKFGVVPPDVTQYDIVRAVWRTNYA